MAVHFKSAAVICNTTFSELETGISFIKSYQFLVSSHNTIFRVLLICLMGCLGDLGRASPVWCRRARSIPGEKQGQKGFMATLESCVSEQKQFHF